MRLLRWRAALVGTAVLVGAVPLVATAYAPPLTCRDVTMTQGWQRIPIASFQPIEGVTSADKVTGYSLAATSPGHVTVTNGKQLKVSTKNGCSWDNGLTLGLQPSNDVPLTGTTSTIVSTATLPSGRVLAAVREGVGVASRPHVVASDNGRTGYRTQDTGLPPQGAPRLLAAANDGRTVYLVLTPSSGATADDGSGLPALPDVNSPTTGAKTGLLYASVDAGRTWALRTSAGDLPGGGGGLDALAVDRSIPGKLYAISNGLLLVSTDGGETFSRSRIDAQDVTAVETGPGGYVIAFTASGRALVSTDGRTAIGAFPAPRGVTSAAYRGTPVLPVESRGSLTMLDLQNGRRTPVPGLPLVPGSLRSDAGPQATYHALSGHSLVRFSDPPLPTDPVPALDDLGVPPPPPGTITPAARTVKLKVGDSTVLDYALALPKSPTPLDLMFLIDSSTSMNDYIEDLKKNISDVTGTVQRAGIDLKVGVATLGTGHNAQKDGLTGPAIDSSDPSAGTIPLYQLFRRIGPPDAEFARALHSVRTRNQSNGDPREAQLAALEQATAGEGIKDPRGGALNPLYLVPPGQDAGWRQAPGIRRLIVHATDEAFDNPDGSPRKPDGSLDFAHTIALMNRYHVQQIGLTVGSQESQPDLAHVAAGTHTYAPPGGADCGEDVILRAGQPLVCGTSTNFSAIIGRLVRSLSDRQSAHLVARGGAPKVIRALDASHLRSLDVTVPNTVPFTVAVTCKGRSVGRYTEDVAATLRDVQVASTRLTVDCLGPAAAAALLAPPAASVAVPAPAPLAQAPAAVVPAPPAAQPQLQPQSQPQVQSQVNPVTAAALQQQEELQLALALQTDQQAQPGQELAMVGRRRSDEGAALVLLATAMAASAAFGLARLRHRPDPALVRVRR